MGNRLNRRSYNCHNDNNHLTTNLLHTNYTNTNPSTTTKLKEINHATIHPLFCTMDRTNRHPSRN